MNIQVQSVINLYEAALWMKSVRPENLTGAANATPIDAEATIESCRFTDNERGVTLVGIYRRLEVVDCTFIGNAAVHAGAGMLVRTVGVRHGGTWTLVAGCTFEDNSAGRYEKSRGHGENDDDDDDEDGGGGGNDTMTEDHVGGTSAVGRLRSPSPSGTDNGEDSGGGGGGSIGGDTGEIRLDEDCCKGRVTPVGKGGAIRIQRGHVKFNDSRFVNNTATLLGGSVFIDIDGYVTIDRSYFENTADGGRHAFQGDVLYSDGKIHLNGVVIVMRAAANGLSVFRHSGSLWSLILKDMRVRCPVGYDLRYTNSSSYQVMQVGLIKGSMQFDQLSLFCESCPRNKYSIEFGFLNHSLIFHEEVCNSVSV